MLFLPSTKFRALQRLASSLQDMRLVTWRTEDDQDLHGMSVEVRSDLLVMFKEVENWVNGGQTALHYRSI